MLTFRGAPSGKGLEAWRDNFSLKVGVVRIRVLVSKKYPFGKEGARARAGPREKPFRGGPWRKGLPAVQNRICHMPYGASYLQDTFVGSTFEFGIFMFAEGILSCRQFGG